MVFDVPLHPSPSRPKLMTVKKKWTVIPGFLALAAAATLLSAYSGASTSQGLRVEQPVKFVHAPHVAKAGMNCLYCHSGANKAPDPGNASVQTCMGCHLVVKAGSAEIKKVADYYNKGLPIPWNRVHKVPDYVQFPHMRHVNAGVTCQTCHGPIETMERVRQIPDLTMGWCVNCHRDVNTTGVNGKPVQASTDCISCHQ